MFIPFHGRLGGQSQQSRPKGGLHIEQFTRDQQKNHSHSCLAPMISLYQRPVNLSSRYLKSGTVRNQSTWRNPHKHEENK